MTGCGVCVCVCCVRSADQSHAIIRGRPKKSISVENASEKINNGIAAYTHTNSH